MRHGKPAALDVTNIVQQHERQVALEYIAEAWNTAEDDGLTPEAMAYASLFAALTTFVKEYGEDATAALVEALPPHVRAGEYNLERSLQ